VKLFKLETPDLWLPHEINLMFVRATDERNARYIARAHAAKCKGVRPWTGQSGSEGFDEFIEAWIDPGQATCEEIAAEGSAGVVHHVKGYN